MVLLREVAGRLQAQVKQTTQAINRLHNLLARAFPELATLTDDIAAGWVLQLLDKYPTAERIAAAHLASLEKIPYLSGEQAEALHQAAKQSVASLRGDVAEALVRDLVAQVRHCQQAEEDLRQLLIAAFADLPASPHVQVAHHPRHRRGHRRGPGRQDRGHRSLRDARPPGRLLRRLSRGEQLRRRQARQALARRARCACRRKGNDLVRAYLWNAARVAIRHNPAIRALYRRLRAKGKRGDVAIGHCMRKLLHLVFAVWKTDRPFDEDHFPWEAAGDTASSTTAPPGRRGRRTLAPTRRPWATSGTCPRKKWSPRPPPP